MPKLCSSPTATILRRSKLIIPSNPSKLQRALITHDHSSTDGEDGLAADAERVYRILRKFHDRPSKLDLVLRDSAVPLRPALLDRVLARCGPAAALGFSFFSWASRQPAFVPSPNARTSVVKMLAKMRHFGAAWALVDRMRRETPEAISPDLFVALMRRFASARMAHKAIEVLDEMPTYGCEPDGYIFGCLLDALAKNGAVKVAAALFEDMRDRFPPDIRHFTALLYGWCRAGKLDEAKFVLVRMRESGFEPDIVVYNTLLSGFASTGKMEDGYSLLKAMRGKGCEPNAVSYTTLVQALCARERMDEAMRVFLEMRRNKCVPDSLTYTTLISGFCRSGKIEKGYELLSAMAREGCRPNPSAYFYIFAAHEKKEELEECLELMGRMLEARCLPNVGIYNTVIRLACKVGDLKVAVNTWNEMEGSGLSPGLDTFVIMVNGLLSQGSLVEACAYFKEMVGRGLLSVPQYGILKDLLNSLLRDEKLELAKEVWDCIVRKGCELNVHAWTIWIHALFSNKHVKEACSYCLDMMDASLMPQPDTFAKLMKGLKKLYNRQIAAEITEKVRQMAAERDVTFKKYKRRGVVDLREKAKAKAKRERRKRKSKRPQQGRRRASASTLFSGEEAQMD